MKNILRSLICLIILSSSMTVFSQKKRLKTETEFMYCFYQSLPDKGVEFLNILKKAEQKLIDFGYLKDKSGESYLAMYRNLDNMFNEKLQDLGVAKYMTEVSDKIISLESEDCMQKVFSAVNFKDSKLSRMLKLIASLKQAEPSSNEFIEQFIAILDPEDFTHDYYKMTTFTMIESMNYVDLSFTPQLPKTEDEKSLTEEERKHALFVKINAEQQIFVNDEKIAIEVLRKKVISYFKQNTSKSIVVFQTSRMTEYGNFMRVQERIQEGLEMVRDELAKETYKRFYSELSTSEQTKIKETYPLQIKNLEIDE
ncbi:biopolymer transporter ExbD [uncultured Kordia sp.]|uniref:ExbD/TolR family protein n=1 Tax=uncultured Kordia sp. TaxID=507699 RepID=UPI002608A3D0|nr:biopolymer transporter ExbD [uncultured Kordia sp.]